VLQELLGAEMTEHVGAARYQTQDVEGLVVERTIEHLAEEDFGFLPLRFIARSYSLMAVIATSSASPPHPAPARSPATPASAGSTQKEAGNTPA